ncbi:MAG: TonB-dependent receptor plug domain-containing protein [Sphingomonadales bacterium]|nr:TonB-dependent receptor plug domain-containing protein [Sphingomonadales bacterium]
MKKLSSLTLLKVAAAPAVLGLALLSSTAFAQEPQNADEAEEGEAIIVTGSRIQTGSDITVAPVQVITAATIQESGVINIQNELLKNPAFGTPTYSRTANAFNSAGAGIATVDLRNLGVDRTLVLVNGRRHVSGVPGGNAVDLTAIPTPLIERVEVLTSGSASAIYGSDAVAGVVNFILKKDFEGLELNAQSGIAQTGDDFNFDTSAVLGTNFADGRGNVTLFMGYSEQGAVFKRNHATEAGTSNIDNISQIFFGGNMTTPRQPYLSGYSPQGTYYTDNYAWTYANNGLGALRPCASTNGGLCDLSGTPLAGSALDGTRIGPDGFNRTAYRYLAVPVQRYLLSAMGHYDFNDNLTAFFEGSFVSASAKSQIEAFPWDTDTSGKQYANGQMPIETLYNGTLYRNPFVPDAIFNDASDTDGDGLRDIFVSKRLNDFGTRSTDSTQQTFRLVGGLRGNFNDNWSFEVFGNYGQTNVSQTGTGQINVMNFRESQKIVPDGNGGYICADPNAVAGGCVPANIFGLNSIKGAALTYLEAPSNYLAVLKETQIGANVTGSIPSLWGADPVGVTVGVEYRRESSDERWDERRIRRSRGLWRSSDSADQQGLRRQSVDPWRCALFGLFDGWRYLQLERGRRVRSDPGRPLPCDVRGHRSCTEHLRAVRRPEPGLPERGRSLRRHRRDRWRRSWRQLPCGSGRCGEHRDQRHLPGHPVGPSGRYQLRWRQPEPLRGKGQDLHRWRRDQPAVDRCAAQSFAERRLLLGEDRGRDRGHAAPVHPGSVLRSGQRVVLRFRRPSLHGAGREQRGLAA